MRVQRSLEDDFRSTVLPGDKPTLLLTDRGMMDSKAYCSREDWEALLKRNDWTEEALLKRYVAVIHMTTAAYGAESCFTTANNAARTEGIDEARAVDDKTKRAWRSHQNFRIVDNSTDFATKTTRVGAAIAEILATQVSEPTRSKLHAIDKSQLQQRRYLVRNSSELLSLWPEEDNEEPPEMTFIFLDLAGDCVLRRESRGGVTVYAMASRNADKTISHTTISQRMFHKLEANRELRMHPVHFMRRTVVHGDAVLKIDRLTSPRQMTTLSLHGSEKDIKDFEKIQKDLSLEDITDSKDYSKHSLASLTPTDKG